MSDLIIRNVKVFYNGSFFEGAGVEVTGGRISGIHREPVLPKNGEEMIDGKGKILFPGLIDPHVHLRVPGLEHKEDYSTGSAAAVAGGVTTILDMPNTNPPTTTVDLLEKKIEIVKKYKTCVDYGFHFQGARDNAVELEKLADSYRNKIASVKIFTAGHETTPTTIPDHESLDRIFSALKNLGLQTSVHAEKQDIIKRLEKKYKDAGRKDFLAWCGARNEETTIESVREILELVRTYGTKTHICHASTGTEMDMIVKARQNGLPVTCDVTWYNLFLNLKDAERLGSFGKVSPALKTEDEQYRLFQHVLNGNADFIITEHTPHTLDEKAGDAWTAPAGMPGLDTFLPVLLTKGLKRGLTYGLIAELCAENPAKYYGLEGKGKIEKGYYADLVLFDPKKEWKVKRDELKTKCGWSSLEGETLVGKPDLVFLRGKKVYEDGEILEWPGKWVYELNYRKSGY